MQSPPGRTTDHPLILARAVARAYRAAITDGLSAGPATDSALAAYLASGGAAEGAAAHVSRIIANVAAEYPDWLYAPVWRRLAREEEAMKRLGWWPGPLGWEERRALAREAVRRVFGEGHAGEDSP
jgi:hypothetical protein